MLRMTSCSILFMQFWMISHGIWRKTTDIPTDFLGHAVKLPSDTLYSCLFHSMNTMDCNYWGTVYAADNCTVICTNNEAGISLAPVRYQVIYRYDKDVSECPGTKIEIKSTTMGTNQDTDPEKLSPTTIPKITTCAFCIPLKQRNGTLMKVDVEKLVDRYEMEKSPVDMPNAPRLEDCANPAYVDTNGTLKPYWLNEGPALFLVWNQETTRCLGFYGRLLNQDSPQKPESFVSVQEILNDEQSLVYFYHPDNKSCDYTRKFKLTCARGTTPKATGLFYVVKKLFPRTFSLAECESMCPRGYQLASINTEQELNQVRAKLALGKPVGIGLYNDIIYNETYWADGATGVYRNYAAGQPSIYGAGQIAQSRFTIVKIGVSGKVLIPMAARPNVFQVHGCLCRREET